jgi:hypothetical protein
MVGVGSRSFRRDLSPVDSVIGVGELSIGMAQRNVCNIRAHCVHFGLKSR